MSDNIFKEIYAKVISLFKQTEKEDNAKDIAKNRLRVVLMQDRTNLTPELLERMRKELVELLSKYVEMDKEALELNFDQEGDQMALMLSIPVIRAKDEAEIEKTLAEEDAKKETSETDEEEDTSEEEKEEETKNDDSEENSEENNESSEEDSDDNETEDSDEDVKEDDKTEENEDSSEETVSDEPKQEDTKKEKKNK